MGLLDSVKTKIQAKTSEAQATFNRSAHPSQPLGANDVFRYRQQRGVNLGSWFVLEAWITPEPFKNAVDSKQADLDIAKGNDAKAVLEHHWDTWITDDDWKWIKDRGFNSVRLPIGYYHLAQPCPKALEGTDFAKHADVFMGAWERIVKAIEKAGSMGIGVLVDLHAAAGGQNDDGHSGCSGKPNLFGNKKNLASTSTALRFLAQYLAHIPHVVGLQLLNEPANNNAIQGWYESTISGLRPICGPDFPLYVHDAWDTAWYAQWVGKRDDFVVVDHHLYRCFTDKDNGMNGDQHAQDLRGGFGGTFGQQSGQAKGQLAVAEWSASLSPKSIGSLPAGEQDRHRREFVKAQLELFEKNTGGWWFWTLKLAEPWNAGWSARNAGQAEILPKWVGEPQKGAPGGGAKEQGLKKAEGEPEPSVSEAELTIEAIIEATGRLMAAHPILISSLLDIRKDGTTLRCSGVIHPDLEVSALSIGGLADGDQSMRRLMERAGKRHGSGSMASSRERNSQERLDWAPGHL